MPKVYSVVDNSEIILTTTDPVKAALEIMRLAKKYEEKQSWFGFWEEDLK